MARRDAARPEEWAGPTMGAHRYPASPAQGSARPKRLSLRRHLPRARHRRCRGHAQGQHRGHAPSPRRDQPLSPTASSNPMTTSSTLPAMPGTASSTALPGSRPSDSENGPIPVSLNDRWCHSFCAKTKCPATFRQRGSRLDGVGLFLRGNGLKSHFDLTEPFNFQNKQIRSRDLRLIGFGSSAPASPAAAGPRCW